MYLKYQLGYYRLYGNGLVNFPSFVPNSKIEFKDPTKLWPIWGGGGNHYFILPARGFATKLCYLFSFTLPEGGADHPS